MRSGKENKHIVNKNRKKYFRLNEHFFIFYLCAQNKKTLDIQKNPVVVEESITKNIGGGGIMFEREKFILPLSEISIEIYFPLDKKKKIITSIFTLGEVAWVKKIGEGNCFRGSNRYQIGVNFKDIETKDKHNIIKYINEKLSFQKNNKIG